MGFAIPVEQWLQKELKPMVNDFLSEDKLKEHGLFNTDVVLNIVSQFYRGHKEKYLHIWHLLMFQMWYERWMKDNSV